MSRSPGHSSVRKGILMTTRLALKTMSLAIVAIACATAPVPRAEQQKTAPAAPPPKKSPYLKMSEPWPDAAVLQARRTDAERRPIFQKTEPLAFTLAADFKLINKDRKPESTARYPGLLSMTDERGREYTLHVRLSPRGHLRRMARTCEFVPLRVEFMPEEISGTVFEGQTNLKLGAHCQDDKAFDQYVLREYLTYPLFNLVTPRSFRARLAHGTYVDAKTQKTVTTRYAIFLEHENDVARRLGGRDVQLPRTEFKDFHAETLNTMMLFEYMIGNTDFSLWANHNVVFVQDPERTLFPVPFDFDLTGLAHPPYAIPDRRFPIRSVSDRLYRGPCRTVDELETSAALFRAKRSAMTSLIDGTKELESQVRGEMKDYLDGFFRSIQSPTSIKKQFVDGCKPAPTM